MGKYTALLVLLVVASADLLRCYADEPAAETVKGGMDQTAESVKGGMDKTAESVKGGMDQAAESVKAGAEHAKDGAAEAMHDAKEATSSWADWAADKISHGFGFNQQQPEEAPGQKMESTTHPAGGN